MAGSAGVADPNIGHLGRECVDVLVVACGGNQDAGQRVADLTAVGKAGRPHSGGDLVGCGVIEDDRRGLAAEFETDLGEVGAARCGDGPARRGGTGERDLVHAAVADELLADRAVARQHADNTRRQVDMADHLG